MRSEPTSHRKTPLADRGRIQGLSAATFSLVRALPRLFARRPGTPLRVLCVIAFDTVHRLRYGRGLPRARLLRMATLLDYGALVNAQLDNKAVRLDSMESARQEADLLGMNALAGEYRRRLTELERDRPAPGGGIPQFHQVRIYRESVASLSLHVLAAAALSRRSLSRVSLSRPTLAIEAYAVDAYAVDAEHDLEMLFRIVMQCQILDDLIDYAKDRCAGLPSFLTATSTLGEALELTDVAAKHYAGHGERLRRCDFLPLRLALAALAALVNLSIRLCRWRDGLWGVLARGNPADWVARGG